MDGITEVKAHIPTVFSHSWIGQLHKEDTYI